MSVSVWLVANANAHVADRLNMYVCKITAYKQHTGKWLMGFLYSFKNIDFPEVPEERPCIL